MKSATELWARYEAGVGESPPLYMTRDWASASAPRSSHACNCIGCCRRCGTCRTWLGHTKAYCDLLVRQKAERLQMLAKR